MITDLERLPHIIYGELYYLLPERLEQIKGLTFFPELVRAFEAMQGALSSFDPTKAIDLTSLIKNLEKVFQGKSLPEVVFQRGIYSDEFRAAKRILFDTLYLLYILRRRATVNLEYVIEGLRVLHVLEALAIDSLFHALKKGAQLSASDTLLKNTLDVLFPELGGWNGSDSLSTLPLIQTKADFEGYLTATPVIHPIFARLHRYRLPFNDLKPIGIGDLKVVKQWLSAYLPGEISHVENVLKGEVRERNHRRLEKTEESFSFSSDYKESSQKDSQSTERLELKREVENVVKTDLNIGANASLTYNSQMIVATVGANFGYKRDTADQTKTSNNFWQETVNKAIQQVEKSTAERRSITKLFETEETNKHSFSNTNQGATHITGIYRWIDKKYKAQLFNFGKRMMFEFVIPEPAAFFVESRLRAFESMVDCPQPPKPPTLKTASLAFTADKIDAKRYQELQQSYDLTELPFPELKRTIGFVDSATGENYFEKLGLLNDDWVATTYNCKLNAKQYTLKKVTIDGLISYRGKDVDEPDNAPMRNNTLVVFVEGVQIHRKVNNASLWWQYTPAEEITPEAAVTFTSDDATLTLGVWDGDYYRISIRAELELSAGSLLEWQVAVFKKVLGIEQQKVDKENQELQLAYNSQLATYRSRLAELKATSVNDLLQGQAEAFNREIIGTELKKHCLALLTKEFDADPTDDLLTDMECMDIRLVDARYTKFSVTEDLVENATSCGFSAETKQIGYPSIDISAARDKGRYIQFLEQAFEWRQLAYIFYPYFWATPPKWIEMMNRQDDTDRNMTAFLQAGSVRILLAVTPAYEDAVLHFVATREPWQGGPAPVIGDPLFIPLHEEVRKQQDDLYNATPEGDPWPFILPTSLVYLEDGGVKLPEFPDPPHVK